MAVSAEPSIELDEGLHQRIARLARQRPDAPAVIAPQRRLSYGELDATADAWAAGLTAAGVGPGDQVPIILPREADLVIALLAVLKAGAAYALLDPAWPAARLREVTAMLDAPLVIASAEVDGLDLPVWTSPAPQVAAPPEFRPAELRGDAPCCVFFTSGTTGRPKGVLTPHRATARLFRPGSFLPFDEHTVIPLAAPVPWDAFSLELWGALLNGGTSVIVDGPYLNADGLRAGIERHGVTTAWLTSSLFNMVVDEDVDAFRGLRHLMIGGERLSPTHVERFLRRHPDIVLLNGYGPVESTVFATTHRIVPSDVDRPDGIPLGRPVPGTEVHVLDGDRPCAPGEIGEVCVTGAGLGLRYLGDEQLTASSFVTVRIDGRDVRAYRTGDLGTVDGNGLLHFRGRADRQVKVRGHRVEPAEIERRVEELLPVRSCRVVVDRTGTEPRLIACCVPHRAGDPLTGARSTLGEVLPGYQLPAQVVAVDAFPTTAQGKLDERALLAGSAGTAHHVPQGDTAAAAGDASTALVAGIFAEVLGRSGVPVEVPLTDLGGTSLDLGRVCARLAARLGRPVPLARLVADPTARAVAAWIDAGPPAGDDDAAEPRDVGVVPLTPIQLIYLTRHLLDPADLTSHCLVTWVVDGPLDHAALVTALAAVHARHEPLRAAYLSDPRPVARVLDIDPPPLETLPAQPSVEAAVAALRTLFSAELLIEEGDVWRAGVVEAGDVSVFGCVVHHIAFDGWSESVFARDLATAYNAARRGTALPDSPAPPSLARSHRDYLARVAASSVDEHRDRLRAELNGVPALQWPGDQPASGRSALGLVEVPIEPRVVAAVDASARAARVSRFAALLHHYVTALAEITGQDDFAVGIPVAQRHGPGSELAVGCHIALLCLRHRGTAPADGPAALRATADRFTEAFAAQDVPFQDILILNEPPGRQRPPLFQTMFAVQNNAPAILELDGARTTFVRQPYLDVPLDLHAELWPRADGGYRMTVFFRRDVVAESTARQLAECIGARLARTA
ncbi:amino acid adenylation protein [Actinoplanes cyaneus]|uniref:Amino acid adenylation protein n=1 Tax=Actinoplanes cyaneus TaxID=52696 RepID=A0A919IZ29_9ACTN|nr:non-ribosomal peptide synthetase [Actinoplanes cyaneus]GID70735.1 amino acid adenylation protein [Actinoplanes cyaneus]